LREEGGNNEKEKKNLGADTYVQRSDTGGKRGAKEIESNSKRRENEGKKNKSRI